MTMSASPDGPWVINDDRDRTVSGLGARASRQLDKASTVYLQGFVNQRNYDERQSIV